MEDTLSFSVRFKKTGRKVLRIMLVSFLLIGIVIFSFAYWGVYERGIMAGKVLRISEKGVLFKTPEDKINLEIFGALKGASPIAESFDFSGRERLEEVSLSGERVNLHFIKRYARFSWRGEPRYFVTRVERLGIR